MNQFFLFISCKIHLFLTTTSHQYYIPTRNFHNLSDVSNKGRLFLTRPIYLPIRYGRWLGPYDVYLTRPFLHSSGAYRNCHSARRRVFVHDNLAQRCLLIHHCLNRLQRQEDARCSVSQSWVAWVDPKALRRRVDCFTSLGRH